MRRARVRPTSSTAARGVPAMLTHSHPCRFAKTEAAWREGSLQPSSDVATVILPRRVRAREILFEMRLMWAARTQKHTLHGTKPKERACSPNIGLFLCLGHYQLFHIDMRHLEKKHKQRPAYFCFAKAPSADSITLEKLHYTWGAYLRCE